MLSDEEREALQYFNTETRTEEMHYGAVLVKLIEKQQKEIEELKAINKMQKYRIEVIDERELISKDKIKPIQIIDLDGKIHNVYKIEEE